MKFSIIVPVYKVEDYLPTCVDSLLMQDYSSFEVILVDDGSPDNCPQLCDAYAQKDSRVKVVHKENGGLSQARNTGIRNASGDYLLFIDSDDYWNSPSVLSKIREILDHGMTTIVQFGQQKYLQLEDRFITVGTRSLSRYNGSSTELILRELISSSKLTISACSMAISTDFIRSNQLYFKEGIQTEDLEWAIRLYCCEPTWSFSDEYFYIYRMQRAGSITATADYRQLYEYCDIIRDSISLLEQNMTPIKEALMSYMMYHILIVCGLSYWAPMTKEQRKTVLSRLRKLAKGRLCKYSLDKKVKLARVIYCAAGFGIMARVLGFYLNHRGR